MYAMICVLAALAVMWAAIRKQQTTTGAAPARQQRQDVDGIAPHIERAAALLDQLRELDDLQTSLELCAPRERAQALQLEWVNHNGSRHAARVWMDGSASTGSLIAAAAEERAALRSALLEEIRAAYSAGAYSETGTLTDTTRKELTEDARQ